MSTELGPQGENAILARLPRKEYERLATHLEPVPLPHKKTLYESYEPVKYIYFPLRGMISLVTNMENGASVEVGVVGREGLSGIHAALGAESSPNENMVQIGGDGLRMRLDALRAEIKQGGVLQDLILKYTHGLMIQMSQTAACNRLHLVEERLARWLLMSHDRALSDDLPLTHEFLAMMLGTRRAGITGAALSLQAEGLISYTRGHIHILDRKGLENFTCECYSIIKGEFDRLVSSPS